MNLFSNWTKLCKVLGDSTRYKIFSFIKNNDCVTSVELLKKFKISHSTLTFHISKMKKCGLIIEKKSGKFIQYKLNLANVKSSFLYVTNCVTNSLNNMYSCCKELVLTDDDFSNLFKLHEDKQRLEIWQLITQNPGITGKELHVRTKLSEANVSFHCKKLIESKLINFKKFGNQTYYWLDVTLAVSYHNEFCKHSKVGSPICCGCCKKD